MKKNTLLFILLMLLIADIVYSFYQHLHLPLDGDMAGIIMPGSWYQQVLDDPFGLSVLLKNEVYGAPNRFFAHWSMVKYFKTAPLWIQSFAAPVDSVYIACAIAKTFIQVWMIFLIASYINPNAKFFSKEFLIPAALLTPLFQASGYNETIGMIDGSITYTFFYALAMCWVLLFFLPFYKGLYNNQPVKLNIFSATLLIVIAVVITFNGPLDPAVSLIVCAMVLSVIFIKYFQGEPGENSMIKKAMDAIGKIQPAVLYFFIFMSLLGLYSFYIGRNNSENFATDVTLLERYKRLPKGLFNIIFYKAGFALLIAAIVINVYLINRMKDNAEAKKILTLFKWIFIFSAIYTLLLPLGGYREYRYNIIRRDSYMPVLLCAFFLYGLTAYFLINHIAGKYQKIYVTCVIVFALVFTIADNPILDKNACEKDALEKIAASKEDVVLLDNQCNIMSWGKITNQNGSDINSQMLEYWGVTKGKKLYYQK